MDIRDPYETAFRSSFLSNLSLRRNGPEFSFWKTFFTIANETWLRGFEARTMRGENYISWDFIDKVDGGLPMGQQYQQAVGVVFEKSTNTLSASDCAVLLDSAMQVVRTREMEHGRFPVDPTDPVWNVHEKILQLWTALANLLREKAGRSTRGPGS